MTTLDKYEGTVQTFLTRETPKGFVHQVPPLIVAIGTVADQALESPSLRRLLHAVGLAGIERRPLADPTELSRTNWSLAIVLSPYKQTVQSLCTSFAPAAAATGVVDTLVRMNEQIIGFNTNMPASRIALTQLTGNAPPQRALLIGTGATASSILHALSATFPDAQLGVMGRRQARTATFVDEFDGSAEVVDDLASFSPDLLINATTVGEKSDAEALPFAFTEALTPGIHYFDVNNRASLLQTQALKAGCIVMSGIYMQSIVNALRVGLATPAASK